MHLLLQLFASSGFQPHGYCYQWNSGLVWLHVLSDGLIATAYFTIPVTLAGFVRKRRDLPFSWMFVLFGLFIVACGTTHLLEIWNLWHAQYWLAGLAKAITALASVGTAILLTRLVPQALALPRTDEWAATNVLLREEIAQRQKLEAQLRIDEAEARETAALLDLTHDAIFVRNLENQVVFWNSAGEKLYGWQRDEVYGRTAHSLLHTVFPVPLPQIDAEILATGYWDGELTHQRRDGSVITVSSRWALNEAEGKPTTILESNRDITHRKREEEKFRGLLEAAPDAVVIVNDRGEIILVNSQTEKMFGYSRNELVHKDVESLLPERFRSQHPDRGVFKATPRSEPAGEELEPFGLRKDGSEFPVEITQGPMETADGVLVSNSIRDISLRKQAEERLRQTDEKFRLIVQGVKDYAILMLDPEGRVTTWSEGAQRINGYSAEEIVGEHFSKFYTAEDLAINKPAHELEVARAVGRFEEEGWRVKKGGSRFYASVTITCLRDKTGQLRGFGKVTRDISSRKIAEEELEQQRQQLAQRNAELLVANKELDSFSYSVSHDLRAPLRAIDGFSHALLDDFADKLSDDGKDYLNRIRAATQRMGALIDDLLNLSKLSRGPMKIQRLELSALVSAVADDLRNAHPGRDVQVRIQEALEVTGDPGLLRAVIENLLSNAWKFSSKNPQARIEFGDCNVRGQQAFFVRDNGAGFDPAYSARLFGAFQRLHHVTEFEGTGVGLATVQRIIHRHNGRIWAESAVGQGATFYFTVNENNFKELSP